VVSCRTMCTGRRRHGAPQSALRHWRSTKFPSVQHDKLWPTSIFVRWPSCLELTARTSATNHFNRSFQALSKNVFIRADIALSALETFCSMGYIILLIYLLIYLQVMTITCISDARIVEKRHSDVVRRCPTDVCSLLLAGRHIHTVDADHS